MGKRKKGKFQKPIPVGKKMLHITLCVLAILLIISIITVILLLLRNGNEAEPGVTIPSTTTPSETEATLPETSAPVTEATTEATTKATTEATVPPTTEPVETQAPAETTKKPQTQSGSPSKGGNTSTDKPAAPVFTQPPKAVIKLPYVIPGTTLQLQKVASFDGMFLEDGSDSEVTNVAMLMIKNVGTEAIEFAKVSMTYDDLVLTFETSALASGAVITVQEINRKGCASGDLLECTADVATLDKLTMSENMVSVTENEDNSLTVTNLTGDNIVTIRIFYKYYMPDEAVYVGGITYTAKISNLGAGQSVVVTPSHYASGASKVVMVRTYDTDA